ncbi:MAG: hydrogenase small subunit [Nitrospinota bacterium]
MCKTIQSPIAGHIAGQSDVRDKILKDMDRRSFISFCTKMAATLGLSAAWIPKIAEAVETGVRKPSVIWLHFQECTGDSEAFIRSEYPTAEELILNLISVDYHETIMAASGYQAEAALEQAMEENRGKYIVVIEGAIPSKVTAGPKGVKGGYCMIAGKTALEIATDVCKDAMAVLTVGTCSSYGGVQAQYPNPTGAGGAEESGVVPPSVPLVKIPGCPHNVVNSVATIVNFLLLGSLPKTDKVGRPVFAYGKRIHDNCPRRAHFDAGQFVEEFGDQGAKEKWCLYKVGCKGPQTYHNCAWVEYNQNTSWPIKGGHGCIGCSEPEFWENMQPFYERLPKVSLPGVEATADQIGITLVGAATLGATAHAIYTYASRNKFNDTSGE